MRQYKKGDRVVFNIGANEEVGIIESIDNRGDGTAMAAIRYETKGSGQVTIIQRNVEKIQPAVIVSATCAGRRARAWPSVCGPG
ncbi:uncharacterized protein SRS1_11027 [Sporisorium reilianum f. sp. reilianum]|uniref:Hypervirulence associated protein TUDOR domain-containing protein n=1 Tax=Sporisorium reilianum f. sp. reilianum TaxID=72559 RepID=A0A2N8UCN5_9BASI|nr:uncharacterized protein SRS1_11027 [Sporisorium reilianum f. sp. reilianum]